MMWQGRDWAVYCNRFAGQDPASTLGQLWRTPCAALSASGAVDAGLAGRGDQAVGCASNGAVPTPGTAATWCSFSNSSPPWCPRSSTTTQWRPGRSRRGRGRQRQAERRKGQPGQAPSSGAFPLVHRTQRGTHALAPMPAAPRRATPHATVECASVCVLLAVQPPCSCCILCSSLAPSQRAALCSASQQLVALFHI